MNFATASFLNEISEKYEKCDHYIISASLYVKYFFWGTFGMSFGDFAAFACIFTARCYAGAVLADVCLSVCFSPPKISLERLKLKTRVAHTLTLTFPWPMTLNFHSMRATVTTHRPRHIHAKNQGQRPVGSKDTVERNRQADRTDCSTFPG